MSAMSEVEREKDQGLYIPLQKPPTAFSLTVRKLLGKVQEGAIRVPKFQRPLRWKSKDVVELFDSILKGYPIGSLLFWKHKADADQTLRIGNATLNVPAVDDAWFIVDGQQRVTALAASLLGLDQHGLPTWELHFDPQANEVLPGPVRTENALRHVPLSDLGDLRRLGKWLRDCSLDEQGARRVEEVQQRLLDYELPGYLMETDNVDALRGVFARLNSTGVRMQSHEVFQALLGDSGSPSPTRRFDLASLQAAVDVDGFGAPPLGEILKAALAISGLDWTRRLEELGNDASTKLVIVEDAKSALEQTVAFLQAPLDGELPGAGIPAYALIPYPIIFVILSRWFYFFPDSDANSRRMLVRWVWKGVATGFHQRSSVSAMSAQVRAIRINEPDNSLRRLVEAVGAPQTFEWGLDPFHARHAASRVEILALLSLAPKSRVGLVGWRSLISSGERLAREVFAVQPKMDGSIRKLAQTAANRVLLDSQHTDLRSEVKSWNWSTDSELLQSHLIDEASFKNLCDNDAEKFLFHRGARLRTLVSKYVQLRAGLDEPAIFPADSYYEAVAEVL
jgi:hypothetical protein